MKKTFVRTFLAVLLCLSLVPMTSAMALKASGSGIVRRGYFEDSGISFQIPSSFSLDGVDVGSEKDVITFSGPKDINGFIPKITVTVHETEYDLDTASVDDVESYIENELNGSNVLNLIDEKIAGSSGDMLRRVFFYNVEDGRMGIVYMYQLNLGGYGATYAYQAYTATRTLPSDLADLPDLIKNFTIE